MTYNDTKSSVYKLKISNKLKNPSFSYQNFYQNPIDFFLLKYGTTVKHDSVEIEMMFNVDPKWLNLVHLIIIMILVDFAADSVT